MPRTPTRPSLLWTQLDVAWSPLLRQPPSALRPTLTTANAARPNSMLADLADTKVQHLLALTFDAMRARGLPLPQEITATSSSKPDIYDNASFDRITCAGLPQKYDGSPDNLIPTLNLIHIWR